MPYAEPPFNPREDIKSLDQDGQVTIVEISGMHHVGIYYHEDSGDYHFKGYRDRGDAKLLANRIVDAINAHDFEGLDSTRWHTLPHHLLANVDQAYERHLEDRGNTAAFQEDDSRERYLEAMYFGQI